MTDSTAPAPTGLKKLAGDLGLKAYLASPPPVQNAMLKGVTAAQPLIARARPHAKQVLGGGAALVVLRKLRHR